MCLPKAPAIPAPPPPPQEAKAPDANAVRQRKGAPPQAGTLLTGPSGITAGSLNTGGATLLGG